MQMEVDTRGRPHWRPPPPLSLPHEAERRRKKRIPLWATSEPRGEEEEGTLLPSADAVQGKGKGTHRIHTSGRARHQAARGREMDEMGETSRNFTEDMPT